ncbi:MAG: adenine phosphoribosyltransferase [Candidatus Latescibacteria bacterium]|nr:adenine phosphoribosyltransferase [Candidatus Latescibacterota bacterium]
MDDLSRYIRDVPDFPKPGILFKDITTLLKDRRALTMALDRLQEAVSGRNIDIIAGIESRGFIFGAALADRIGVGFVPIRKPGKLPAETLSESYTLEYGENTVEIHTDAVQANQRVLMVDDLLATGGTMAASCRLVERLGGRVAAIAFLIELAFLSGREKLRDYEVITLIRYE